MRARVLIRPKDGILDPQGIAVERALPALGFSGVQNVHVAASSSWTSRTSRSWTPCARKLLANP